MTDKFVRYCGSVRITLVYTDKPEDCEGGPLVAHYRRAPAAYHCRLFDRESKAVWFGTVRLPLGWTGATDGKEAVRHTAQASLSFAENEGFVASYLDFDENDYVITTR